MHPRRCRQPKPRRRSHPSNRSNPRRRRWIPHLARRTQNPKLACRSSRTETQYSWRRLHLKFLARTERSILLEPCSIRRPCATSSRRSLRTPLTSVERRSTSM
uniref:(northern house mosquito) hypothetical protein n=1 Tax=Culex pipiens TaxID=7175 RepID=A0A8D8LDH2_CULPI